MAGKVARLSYSARAVPLRFSEAPSLNCPRKTCSESQTFHRPIFGG